MILYFMDLYQASVTFENFTPFDLFMYDLGVAYGIGSWISNGKKILLWSEKLPQVHADLVHTPQHFLKTKLLLTK